MSHIFAPLDKKQSLRRLKATRDAPSVNDRFLHLYTTLHTVESAFRLFHIAAHCVFVQFYGRCFIACDAADRPHRDPMCDAHSVKQASVRQRRLPTPQSSDTTLSWPQPRKPALQTHSRRSISQSGPRRIQRALRLRELRREGASLDAAHDAPSVNPTKNLFDTKFGIIITVTALNVRSCSMRKNGTVASDHLETTIGQG